jgi:hypothetical protein
LVPGRSEKLSRLFLRRPVVGESLPDLFKLLQSKFDKNQSLIYPAKTLFGQSNLFKQIEIENP